MIIRKNEHWFKMLFIWKGSVLSKIMYRLMLLFILSFAVVFLKGNLFHYKIPLNPAPFTLFGIALALFLGFRNSASYDRFWEARKIWGALTFDSRSLTRQVLTISGYKTDSKETDCFINYLICFAYALKHQLRHTDATADMEMRLTPECCAVLKDAKHKPVLLIKAMGDWVQQAKVNGKIDSILQLAFEVNLNKLSEIVGVCERIASTPIPFAYSVLLHRTVYIYCFLLPFGFVDSLGWFTPILTIFIAYTFVAFEAIADEIEMPFGIESNDLALNSICQNTEISLLEMAGKPIPVYPVPTNYFLD